MKKVISILLASIILSAMSMTAFATEINQDSSQPSVETSVTFTVEPTYVVTIPSTINLTKQADKTYAGSGVISTSAVRLAFEDKIEILIQSDFEMETQQGATQAYTVTIDGTDQAVTNNQKVAEFTTSETAQSVTLNFVSPDPQFAGNYSDTAVFTIRNSLQ